MVSKTGLLKLAAYSSEWNYMTCGILQGSMQGSVFFHGFIHHLQKAGINEVTKFTHDNAVY